MAKQTHTKTQSVTNTKIAVATAFLGAAAVAAAAMGSPTSNTGAPCVVGATAPEMVVEVYPDETFPTPLTLCQGQRVRVLTEGKNTDADFSVRGFTQDKFVMRKLGSITEAPAKEDFLKMQQKTFELYAPGIKYTGLYRGLNKKTGEALFYLSAVALPSQSTCTDSDGGNMPLDSGIVVGANDFGPYEYSDTCLDDQVYSGHLLEYACDGGELSQFQINCKNQGKVCIDGACTLAPPDQDDEAYDSPSSTFSLLPDLVAKSLIISSSSLFTGYDYTLEFENKGDGVASGPFHIGIYAKYGTSTINLEIGEITSVGYEQEQIGEYVGGNKTIGILVDKEVLPNGKGTVNGYIPLSVFEKGLSHFYLVMDETKLVEESDESNNTIFAF